MKTENNTVDFFEQQVKAFVERRRPSDEEIRKQLDLSYHYEKRTFTIFEVRPQWDDPSEIVHIPMVKARYILSQGHWKLFWMRASGKWDPYQPNPVIKELEKVLEEINKDEYGCFWG